MFGEEAAADAISASVTFISNPSLLCFNIGEFIMYIKSLENCFTLPIAKAAEIGLFSLMFRKLVVDIVCSTADLVLKFIIVPIPPFK